MQRKNIQYSILPIILFIGVLGAIFTQYHMLENGVGATSVSAAENLEKQRGAHVFGRLDSMNLRRLDQTNIEWVTLVPWGSQKDVDSPVVNHHNGDSSHIRFHDSSWVYQIEEVRTAGFKVFFKPHLWISAPADGKWRSDVSPASEEDWEIWKESYRNFIIRYAKVAERAGAEMFCVGTEFTILSAERPGFWKNLIREVRSVYSGEITYAANWYNEYENITFWKDLDYIGIQAYFPLAENESPGLEQITQGWAKHMPAIRSVHEKYDRTVLFTEMGYKSTNDSAIKPWEWMDHSADQKGKFSPETQANCYQAFFNTVWEEEWFAGVHIWQLRGDYVENTSRVNLDFTPQGKLAESVIKKGFKPKTPATPQAPP